MRMDVAKTRLWPRRRDVQAWIVSLRCRYDPVYTQSS
jgi:hypothetical protein